MFHRSNDITAQHQNFRYYLSKLESQRTGILFGRLKKNNDLTFAKNY